MSYKVPPSQVLAVAISEALRDTPTISSQRMLTQLVKAKLKGLDPEYSVTEPRVRKMAVTLNLVRLEIKTRDSGIKRRMIVCPVCGSHMQRVRNGTIYGGSVILGYKCSTCPYSTGRTKEVPTQYTFHDAIPREHRSNLGFVQNTL